MQVKVRINGIMGSQCDWREREFSLDEGSTIASLKNTIAMLERGIDFDSLRVNTVVNKQIVQDETQLSEGDEVMFLPPLAGG